MNKITRTFKKYNVNVSVYMNDRKTVDVINESIYDTNSPKEAMRYFAKKYESIGKVIDIEFTNEDETIKAVMDVNTFLSLATIKVI